jgi:hypothetical protein
MEITMTAPDWAALAAWMSASSYACAFGVVHGPRIGGRILRHLSDRCRLRKVGGIWFLSLFRLRFSFCISRR